METVTLPKQEYDVLKRQANIDMVFRQELISSLREIGEGRVRRVR